MRILLAVAFVIVTAVAAFTYRQLLLDRPALARTAVRRPVAHPASPMKAVEVRTEDPLILAVLDSLIGSYMMTIQENPLDVRAMTDLAFLYMRHGWFDRALGPLARAREVDPTSEPLRRYLELALARGGVTGVDLAQLARQFADMASEWGHGC